MSMEKPLACFSIYLLNTKICRPRNESLHLSLSVKRLSYLVSLSVQVFHLMRQDSYVRFLKSDLYKGLLMREMEGHSLPLADTEMPPPTGDTKKKKVRFCMSAN